MNPYIFILSLLGCYLIGSISFAREITRLTKPNANLEKMILTDPESGETMNLRTVGATTASLVLGPKMGWIIVLLDMLKAAVPAIIFRLLFPGTTFFLIFGIAAIVGHIWPIYYRFHGGGGVAATLGLLLVFNPLIAFISVLMATIIGLFFLHETVVCFVGGPWLFLIGIAIFNSDLKYILFSLLINILLIIAILPDIRTAMKKVGKIKASTGIDVIPIVKPINTFLEKIGIRVKKEAFKSTKPSTVVTENEKG